MRGFIARVFLGGFMNNITLPVPNGCVLHWTESAKYCCKIGCNCSRCVYLCTLETIRPDTCRMKAVVLGLTRKFGKPNLDGVEV